MAWAMQEMPERRSAIEIGTVILYIDLDYFDPRSRIRARHLGGHIADVFDRVEAHGRQMVSLPEGLRIGEYNFPLMGVFIGGVDLEAGSITQKLKIIAVVGAGIIQTGAAYPEFKEAVPQIIEDVKSVVYHISQNELPPGQDIPRPADISAHIRDEVDVADELRKAAL